MVAAADAAYMRRALALAERGRGSTSPNPMVGAVVVDARGVVVGTGYHRRAGGPHAEVFALDEAGARAFGATLYCTLEPCCHTGRTGPCADRVLAAGIARVVGATADPNPLVSGRGFERLRAGGIAVDVGVGATEARRLNAPFFTWTKARRPFVVAKIASGLDGGVAARPGVRTAISSARAQRKAQELRAEVDGILVGSGTLLADDPLLTARDVYRQRPLARIILDGRLRTSPTARVLRTLSDGPVTIVADEKVAEASPTRLRELRDAGAEIELLPRRDLASLLCRLAGRGMTSLLVEGGPQVLQSFWNATLVDRLLLFIAPDALGPEAVLWWPRGLALSNLDVATVAPCGPDVLLDAYVHRAR